MQKITLFVIAFLLLAGCRKGEDVTPLDPRCNTPIADYLYGVEYDTYDFNACKHYFDSLYIPADAGCSEVRRGCFVGRNLDWYFNGNAAAIIKVNHSDNHFASIGMVGCFPQFSNEVAESGAYSDVYRYLPFKTEDGVNEHGLYVGINVVPTGETSPEVSSWHYGTYGIGAAHTNPGAEMTCAVNYLPRILLDRARNVDEAKRIIASIDWTDPLNYPHAGETQSFHFLICDPDHSVVLEFIDNKPCYIEATSVTDPGFGTIMTNFNNALWHRGIMQYNGCGYERFELLYRNYLDTANFPDNFLGMQRMMESVWYTNFYTTPIDSLDSWLTEAACSEIPAPLLYHNYQILRDPYVRNFIQSMIDDFNSRRTWHADDCPYWISTHTSIYDLSTRQLRVLVHEGLDGMKSYYHASLDSHFAHPID